MDIKLKAVAVPVSDVDRARHFYRALGFRLDLDQAEGDVRVVQLTPPGSQCSIIIGTGISSAEPGSAVCVLRVNDLGAAVADLRARGVAPSPVSHCPAGFACLTFTDPDGNTWLLVDDVPVR
ncbi:VOC family protein [Kribbella qitaiheensis]|uniref:VOC family protein n=1 Tax=Kribbella qitaiheensis TaxID=1544730 RepID=UPI0036198AA3